jgi:penicillin G amidase
MTIYRFGLSLLLGTILSGTGAYASAQERLDQGPQVEAQLALPELSGPVTVMRDRHGIPYIFASNTPDLIRAQGFVTGQNRLFQMEFYRLSTAGRLAEVVGEAGLGNDREMRLIGIRRNAERHAALLSPEAKQFLGWYVAGLNAYIRDHTADHPAELKLMGLTPTPWTIEDVVTILHFANWSQAANYKAELLTQKLIDRFGLGKVQSDLLPILTNPDRQVKDGLATSGTAQSLGLAEGRLLVSPEVSGEALAFGSNNWAVAPARTASKAAVVVNDPHLDARALPGPWHPVGLHAPGIRAIGVALPGIPGLLVGRNEHVGFGVTNAYGDSQDLFIERTAPGRDSHYLEGENAIAFGRIEETIRVRDPNSPSGFRTETMVVRTTKRGPIVAEGLADGRLLSLRTAAAELPGGGLGFDQLLTARNAAEVDAAVQAMDVIYFNYVFGDKDGVVGHRASGRVPIRRAGHGSFPTEAGPEDGWTGMIPPDRMPGQLAPERGWVGTANHDTRPDDLDLYYTSYAAPDYRYRRMIEVLDAAQDMTTADQSALMLDTKNLQVPRLLPALVATLGASPEYADLAAVLADWDGRDDADAAAPLIYQRLYQQLAYETFVDDMGEDLAKDYLKQWYVWQERFDRLIATPDSPWFDDSRTTARETLPDLILRSAGTVRTSLAARHGADPAKWTWGSEHRIAFFSLLRPSGPQRDAFGFAERPMSGSGETVMRARTSFMSEPVEFFASMRFVADLGDPDRVEAVLSGGAVDRQFHPHQKDQLPIWTEGKLTDWWLSPEKVKANAVAEQTLTPQ